MESLLTKLKSINYNYYNGIREIDFDNFHEDDCIKFIGSYFKSAGKSFLINGLVDFYQEQSSRYRATHSVVAYLLGVIFFEAYKGRIEQVQSKEDDRIYLFVLFLTFLYHDFYHYKDTSGVLDKIANIESELISLNIEGLDKKYIPCNIRRYYEYRVGNEHGIYAGYKLNKGLKEHLEKVLKNGYKQNGHDYLVWTNNDIPYYDLASSAIIKHNIWLANSDSDAQEQKERVACYEEKDLKAFIINNKERVKFKDNPLLFMLFIIDTIEPIKMLNKSGLSYYNSVYRDLLSNIEIKINQKSLKLKYFGNFKSIGCHTFCEAKKMETWMNVTVSQTCTASASILSIKF